MIRVSNSNQYTVGFCALKESEVFIKLTMDDNNRIDDIGQSQNVLIDQAKNGKERPWREKKNGNVIYYETLALLGFKKAERVSTCAEVLEFNVFEGEEKRLKKAWFCKSPLCPICNWRKAVKHSYQVMRVVSEVVRQRPSARWLFLTLTVKNAWDGEELDKSLRAINRAFNRLTKYKKVQKNLIGFVRSTEVTVNPENGSYNQHIHVLLCVKSTYFKNKENYIEQKEWTSFWQRAMQVDYTPIVHIQIVKDVRKKEVASKLPAGLESAVKETAKYAVKSADYLTDEVEENISVVQDLEQGLYNKRMVGWGGLLKEVHGELNLKEDDEDLVLLDDEKDGQVEEAAYVMVARWHWYKQNYFIVLSNRMLEI